MTKGFGFRPYNSEKYLKIAFWVLHISRMWQPTTRIPTEIFIYIKPCCTQELGIIYTWCYKFCADFVVEMTSPLKCQIQNYSRKVFRRRFCLLCPLWRRTALVQSQQSSLGFLPDKCLRNSRTFWLSSHSGPLGYPRVHSAIASNSFLRVAFESSAEYNCSFNVCKFWTKIKIYVY